MDITLLIAYYSPALCQSIYTHLFTVARSRITASACFALHELEVLLSALHHVSGLSCQFVCTDVKSLFLRNSYFPFFQLVISKINSNYFPQITSRGQSKQTESYLKFYNFLSTDIYVADSLFTLTSLSV